jgi:hypothetical protein
MPRIPLPDGLIGSEELPRTRRDLQNCFNNGEGRILSRPGIEAITTITGVARGQFEWNGDLYQVQSANLLKITNTTTGANSVIGAIAGADNVEIAVGFNDCVIVVKGGNIYTLSNSTTQIAISGVTDSGGVSSFTHAGTTPAIGNTVTTSGFTTNTAYNVTGIVSASTATTFEITGVSFGTDEAGQFTLVLADISGNSNFVPCVDVCHINGRFVYIPSSGDPAFFSDVGAAGTVQALSFFDAEELPDKNNSCFNFKNTLFIGGTDSFEQFRDTGASPNPFTRLSGSRILNGYIGGLVEAKETFAFIGREKGQDQGIYVLVQGGAEKISNERIDLLLTTYTTAELAAAKAGRFKWRGYDIITFELQNDSLGFLFGNWFRLSTLAGGVIRPWQAGFITQFEKEYFTASSDKFGKLAKVNTDNGERIPRIIDVTIEEENDDYFTVQSLQLGISQGFNAAAKSVALAMSRDNVTYGPYVYTATGAIGQYANKARWNMAGGLGSYQGFAGIRFYTTEDIEFSVDHIIAVTR